MPLSAGYWKHVKVLRAGTGWEITSRFSCKDQGRKGARGMQKGIRGGGHLLVEFQCPSWSCPALPPKHNTLCLDWETPLTCTHTTRGRNLRKRITAWRNNFTGSSSILPTTQVFKRHYYYGKSLKWFDLHLFTFLQWRIEASWFWKSVTSNQMHLICHAENRGSFINVT